jgi:hypothetical protein
MESWRPMGVLFSLAFGFRRETAYLVISFELGDVGALL